MAKLAPLYLSGDILPYMRTFQKGGFMDSVDPLENTPGITPRPSPAKEIVWNCLPVSHTSHKIAFKIIYLIWTCSHLKHREASLYTLF